jgi:hypothetical protein
MKKFILSIATALFVVGAANAQVGIGTTTPDANSILHIDANDKGMLIPRLTNAERDNSLADNDALTPNLNNVPAGLMIYNTNEGGFQYFTGGNTGIWKAIVTTDQLVGGGSNDGAVRLDGQNGLISDKPVFAVPTGTAETNWVTITYNGDLAFSTASTNWPAQANLDGMGNLVNDSDFFSINTSRFKENPVDGQVHIWRVTVSWTKSGNNSGGLECRLFNPTSLFQTVNTAVVPGNNNGSSTFVLFSIADVNSIGLGYQIQLRHQLQQTVTMTVENIARISLFKN